MKTTLLETFDHQFKLILPIIKDGEFETHEFADRKGLLTFLAKNKMAEPEIKFLRGEVPDAAIMCYAPPTEWAKDTGYSFKWWGRNR